MPTEKNPNFWKVKYEKTFTSHISHLSISFIQDTLIGSLWFVSPELGVHCPNGAYAKGYFIFYKESLYYFWNQEEK